VKVVVENARRVLLNESVSINVMEKEMAERRREERRGGEKDKQCCEDETVRCVRDEEREDEKSRRARFKGWVSGDSFLLSG
jgi:hypothetical protein